MIVSMPSACSLFTVTRLLVWTIWKVVMKQPVEIFDCAEAVDPGGKLRWGEEGTSGETTYVAWWCSYHWCN